MKTLFISFFSLLFGIAFFPLKYNFLGLDDMKFDITEEDIYLDLMENQS